MTLGLRPLEARQPGPLLMRRAVALFLCPFHEEVDRTTAGFTCRAHIDEARDVVECLQLSALSGASPRCAASSILQPLAGTPSCTSTRRVQHPRLIPRSV